jgi:nucleotide-binding universal stress UspA family protein
MFKKLLVPLDGSRIAEMALPYARLFANRFKIPVELMTVIDTAELDTQISLGSGRFFDTLVDESMRRGQNYLKGIATTFDGANVISAVEKGRAADVIIDRGDDEGTLITMATHGRSGLHRRLLGSVAEKVLRGTAKPLLLIRTTKESRTDGEAALKSIVVPLDGSELAESVLPAVAVIAKNLDLEIVLFRVFEIPYGLYAAAGGYYAINFDRYIAEETEAANSYLQKQTEALKRQGAKGVAYFAKEGLGADQIISFARSTPNNLLAMCSHGRSGVKRWLLGSVTETVVRYSGDPVLVLRPAIPSVG